MAGSKTAVSCFIGYLLLYFAARHRAVRQSRGKQLSYTSARRELTLARQKSRRRGRRSRWPAGPPQQARSPRGSPAMPLSHIEHYLIAADDMERTRDWYRDVLGMQEGW